MNKSEKKAYQYVLELIDDKTQVLCEPFIKDASSKNFNQMIRLCLPLDEITNAIKWKMDEPYYICSKVNRKSSKCRICEVGIPYPKNKVYEIMSMDQTEKRFSTVGAFLKGDLDLCGTKAIWCPAYMKRLGK